MNDLKKKRILMLRSNAIDPDPRVQKEAKVLQDAGYSVDVFCWDRAADHALTEEIITTERYPLHIYRSGIKASFGAGFKNNIVPLLRFQKDIAVFLLRNHSSYDIIHACDFDTCLTGYICARIKRLKVVYDIFDYYVDAFSVPRILKKAISELDAYLINHSDAVIICSEQRLMQIGNTKPKKLAVIHNSPSKENRNRIGTIDKDDSVLRIAYVGILNDGRLLPELLECVSKEDSCCLDIAGYGKLESLTEEYSLKYQNIVYHGRVGYDKTLELERNSDVIFAAYDPEIPNHKYAAPNKYYEALMLGKPLIMCKNTGLSEELSKQGFGVCIDYSKKSLSDGIKVLKKKYAFYKQNSEREKAYFDLNYDWRIMADRLVQLYSEI